ncbi:MAG TPA: single-stranded-DNA-specific exonuclease RecJ [Thermoanaerobaculia bacterium]|jgi:single-stranded-DNA-specific exonuclease|nr:single-stranded-DNA-specific exonuclease RecJ [Thermoanaerobaculia bacterium]
MLHDAWHLIEPPDDIPLLPIPNEKLRAIVARRGILTEVDYRRFVAPCIEDLHDPATIHGIGEACERIERAVRDNETILIYGDYDVDGVTSIVLLQTVLRALGADAAHVVPHRLVDGYGLKTSVIDRVLTERDVRLIITVDCGITSVDPVRQAIERGIDVIVTDHHLPPEMLPAAAAVLNPKQPGCAYPFKELAGVGVAFKLCCELLRRGGRKMAIASLLKIAAIGTVADVAPLIGENRTIAWLGLAGLSDPRNPGLRALIRRLGMLGRPLRAVDVGFKIGPRINAAGRLSSAETAIDLFAATSEEAAWTLCAELDRLNAERQEIEKGVREEAEIAVARLRGCEVSGREATRDPETAGPRDRTAVAESRGREDSGWEGPRDSETTRPRNRIFVLAGQNWHKGVLGLTAGRIAQRYYRPTLAISIEGDLAAGSGRSIPTINLHEQLESVADLFTHFGGHELACGFALPARNVDALRRRLEERFAAFDDALFRREAKVDAELTLAEIDREFVAAHELLQPFGAGNPQPLFLVRNAAVAAAREFAPDCRELTIDDGTAKALAVLWPSARELASDLILGATVDLLFQIEPDRYAPSGAKLAVVDAKLIRR